VLLAYITDFARELNDRASLTTSTTRAVHLLQRSSLSREAFIQRLYEARALTKERSASIRATTRDPNVPVPVKAKMAYFFACLERLLGFRDDEPTGGDAARLESRHQEPPIPVAQPSSGARQSNKLAQDLPPVPAKNPYTTGKYGRLVQE